MAPKSVTIEPADLYPRATPRGLEVHPATIRALRLFSSHDETRLHLSGVGVDIPAQRDQAWLVATDGHRAMRIPITGTIPGSVASNWSDSELAQAELRAKLHDVEGKTASGAQLLVLPWIEGSRMAPVDQVMPTEVALEGVNTDAMNWNPAYVADVGKAADILGKACRATMVMRIGALPTALSPTRFDIVAGISEHGNLVIAQIAVMPMRAGKVALPERHAARYAKRPRIVAPEVASETPDITTADIPIAAAKVKGASRKRQSIAKVSVAA